MRRCVLRCLLPAIFAVFSAVPAAANPIIETVGTFYFVPCDELFDPDCTGYFVVDNGVNVIGHPFPDLTFFALLTVDGEPIELTDYLDDVLAGGDTADTSGLVPLPAFLDWTTASVEFLGGNFSARGAIAPVSITPGNPSAEIKFELATTTVPEGGSLLVVVIGLGALAVGRALFTQ